MGIIASNSQGSESSNLLFISPEDDTWLDMYTGLVGLGYQVSWCKTVEQAFFISLKHTFSYVICVDCLEDATALEALRLIRKVEANERTPFLALYHQYDAAQNAMLIQTGADDVLILPLSVTDIQATMRARQKRMTAFVDYGASQEQKRIAKEMHDGLQQRLVESKFTLLGLLKAYSPREEVREGINHVIHTLSLAVEDSRSLAFNQLPPVLEKLGLVKALKQLAENIRGVNLPKVSFHSEPLEEIMPQVALMLYRTAQEGISNALKYSQASEIEIFVRHPSEHWVGVSIKDNGVGFELNRILTGNGLINMQNRVNSIGGSLHIKSKPGMGTELFALVPMHELATLPA